MYGSYNQLHPVMILEVGVSHIQPKKASSKGVRPCGVTVVQWGAPSHWENDPGYNLCSIPCIRSGSGFVNSTFIAVMYALLARSEDHVKGGRPFHCLRQ